MDEEGACYEYWWDFVWWEYAGHVNDDHEDDDVVKRGRGNRLALSKGDGPQTG